MIPKSKRTHKDSLFRSIFGSPERKEHALSLYNALAGTAYDDPEELELTTLEDVVYMNVKNDVSFIVGDEIVLFEHQSTRNPNMPLRGLAYLSHLLSAQVERMGANLYGTALVALPAPRYFVFYSGAAERPEREVLRLSDAFGGADADVEVTCTVVNVNEGQNPGLADACHALAAYSYFLARVREYNSGGMAMDEAVDAATDDCVEHGMLADYFRAMRAEVKDVFLTEYDAERQRELDRRDGYEEGGIAALADLVRDNVITADEAAARLNMDAAAFTARAAELGVPLA